MNLEAREEEVGWPKKVWATMPDFLEAEKGGVNRVATRIHSVWLIKNTVSLRIDHFSYGKILQEQLGSFLETILSVLNRTSRPSAS